MRNKKIMGRGRQFPGRLMAWTLSAALLLFGSGQAAGAQEIFALDEAALDGILKTPERRFKLAETIFDLSERAERDLYGRVVNTEEARRLFKSMVRELKVNLRGKKTGPEILGVLNDYIFRKQNFEIEGSSLFEASLDATIFTTFLKNKRGHCLTLSLLYLCFAEKLGLPLNGVLVPGHFFVRLQDGKEKVNVETTARGAVYHNSYYLRNFLIGDWTEKDLADLGKRETVAVYLNNLANHYKLQWKLERAIAMYQAALKIMPRQAAFHTNLGNAYERQRQIPRAIMEYEAALKLNPYLCEAHYNMGLLHYLYTKQLGLARRHGEIAKKLRCRMHPEFRAFLENNPP